MTRTLFLLDAVPKLVQSGRARTDVLIVFFMQLLLDIKRFESRRMRAVQEPGEALLVFSRPAVLVLGGFCTDSSRRASTGPNGGR